MIQLEPLQLGLLAVVFLVVTELVKQAVAHAWKRQFGTRYVTEKSCAERHRQADATQKQDLRAIKKMLARLCQKQGVSTEEFFDILDSEAGK